MSKFNKHDPIWPPPINSPQIQKRPSENQDVWYSPKNLALLFLGFLCGAIFDAIYQGLLFAIFVRIRGEQMLDGVSHTSWLFVFYAGRFVQLASFALPIILYLWLRRKYPSFAVGLLSGGCLIMLLILRLFLVGLQES